MAAQSSAPATVLSATYSSPNDESFHHEASLPAVGSASDPASKSAYLASLRQAVETAQADINRELTKRMEDEKARDAAANSTGGKANAVDEAKEEENYGEEIPEDDD